VAIIFYTWYRISLWRKKIKKETQETSQIVNQALQSLKEGVQEQIELLNKKPYLNNEEEKIRDKLQEALNISKKFISKEIKDQKN
jgi:tRNA C32,U32 (ribose-2'-O)-methylase TrmJ